ncbi:hypothetical protein [Blautia stercoris]
MSQATAAGARMCRGTFFILEKMEGGEKVLGQNRKIQMDKTKGGGKCHQRKINLLVL